MPDIREGIIYIVIGLLLTAILGGVGMTSLVAVNSTFGVTGTPATYAPVFTMFAVLLPVLFFIGVAIKFIPFKHGE
jgi:hypothetical protein